MPIREAPASIGQRLLWFLEHYRPDTASLNCPVVCRLSGPLDVAELRVAVDRLVGRHEALRTTLVRRGRSLVQQVYERLPPPFQLVEPVPDRPGPAGDRLADLVREELHTPVDIGQYPVRVTLWRLAPQEHVLCLNMHHLVSDAWSCGIVMQELIGFLAAGAAGDPGLPAIPWQYADFAQWQHDQLTSGAFQAHQDYWVEQLRGMQLVRLPPARPAAGARPTGIEVATLDPAVFTRLKQIARSERTTPFAVMLSLYYLLLARITGQTDLSVASLFANRSRAGLQSTVGFLANMIVLRTGIDPGAGLLDTVRRVRATVIGGFLHEAIPYQMLPLAFQDSSGRVDDVVFQMLLTPPPGARVTARGVDFQLYTPDSLGSRFGLELGLIPQPSGACQAMLFYTTDRFDPAWAADFLAGYVALARAAAAEPAEPVAGRT